MTSEIKTKDLENQIMGASLTGVRTLWQQSVAGNLTPTRLAAVLLGVEQNNINDFLTLAEEMEERDMHYHAVLSTRKLAVSGLKPVVEAVSDDPKEIEIAEILQRIVSSENFDNLICDQLDAIGKGFAVSEIIWDRSGILWEPKEFVRCDPRFFQFDDDTMSKIMLRDESNISSGIEIPPYKAICHKPKIKSGIPIRGGLARLAVVSFMCKGYALKDWLAFAEVFGIPLRLGKYGDSATPDQKASLLSAVSNIGTDAAAIIPESMMIEFVNSGGVVGGDKLFSGLADWLDRQVSKGVLGQTMTTDDGSSLSQANVHNDVRKDILISDAKQLSSTIRRDFIKPYIDINYGERKPQDYPLFRLQIEEAEDLESLSRSLPAFINLGLRVEESVIRDKFGLPEPDDGAIVLAPKAQAPVGGLYTPSPTTQDKEPESLRIKHAAEILTLRVMAGETLTKDQRDLIALAAQQPDDDIDVLTIDAVKNWEKTMGPVLQPIIDLASRSSSYESFLEELDKMDLDMNDMIKEIATMTFKARGIGDSKVKSLGKK